MEYERRFKFLISSPAFDEKGLEGQRLQQIATEIEALGFAVLRARRPGDAELAVQTDAAIGCIVVDWGKQGVLGKSASLISLVRRRGLDVPVLVLVRRKRLEDIPVEVLNNVDGYVFLAEETPDFVARNLASHLRNYAQTLRTPFFGALLDYAEQGNQLWTCPGHNGGIFYSRSPIGRIFFEHLGPAVFRDDIDNSVLDLGDLLTHEGPALEAQKEAARIFGADRTYFVLNGTSASNKIVLSSLVAEGDLVLFDRNNHKAAHHGALLLAGGIPVYLPTDRNAYGLIGPIDFDALDEERIREQIRNHPLLAGSDHWQRPRPFRAAVIEQCTYDGTINNADVILEKLGPLCDYLVFDEAWAGFMKFHPLFQGRYAMGLPPLGGEAPGIIATQSTHKQLAGFSQASQIHVRDRHLKGQSRRVEHRRFNETFLMHASTSPFYPLFASLDVGAAMMKGRSGEVLWDDTIRLGIELRKKMRAIRREFEENPDPERRWFPDPFVPDTVMWRADPDAPARRVPWEEVPTDALASDPALWMLSPGAEWHGFRHVAPGYAMTDPNKLTLLMPGFDRRTGEYAEHGIPAPLLAGYLRENRIVAEKNDLHSILFLLANQLLSPAGSATSGVDWGQAVGVLKALLFSPVLGFVLAALLLLLMKLVVRTPSLYNAPEGNRPPPGPIRALLVLTCTGVSFFHGSNDGQKGMGLIMLILIGAAPTAYALNRAIPESTTPAFLQVMQEAQTVFQAHAGTNTAPVDAAAARVVVGDALKSKDVDKPDVYGALATLSGDIGRQVKEYGAIKAVPATATANVRNDMYLASDAVRVMGASPPGFDATDVTKLKSLRSSLDSGTKYIPTWVKVCVALALGLGTMVGWKRIVVTVGEKIGKTHLTYAQGASAEIVAMATIGLADAYGLPVSTTHVLSSGVAGAMAANGSGLQWSTVKNMALAWVMTLPAAMVIAGSLYVILRQVF